MFTVVFQNFPYNIHAQSISWPLYLFAVLRVYFSPAAAVTRVNKLESFRSYFPVVNFELHNLGVDIYVILTTLQI